MTTPPHSVRFTVTEEDVVDATRFARRGIRVGALAAATVSAVVGMYVIVMTSATILGLIYVGVALAALVTLWWRPVERSIARRRARTVIGNECIVTLTEEALVYRQTGMSGAIEWSALTEVREDATTLAAYSDEIARIIIPKRAFPTTEAVRAFRREMSERIGR